MTSEDKKIDADKYIDSLPTFTEPPSDFVVELRLMLLTPVMCRALAYLEENSLLAEKRFVTIDYSSEAALAEANALKQTIVGSRAAIENLLALANGETSVN